MPGSAVLDACTLYPTVLREIVLGVAEAGLFHPLWSERILGEWSRAVARNIPNGAEIVQGEIALCRSSWPGAMVPPALEIEAALSLPDANDIHVLATAIRGKAPRIVTLNLRDFPRRTLARSGIVAEHPDVFLLRLLGDHPDAVTSIVENVHGEAERLSGQSWPRRKLLKKARLPRLGKALEHLK